MTRARVAAGLLLYRRSSAGLEVFLIHPGGPYYAARDEGVWSLPKGEIESGHDLLGTARREFEEETGQPVTACAAVPRFHPLGSVLQKGGKLVHAWAFEGDWPGGVRLASNRFTLEWPPRSGQQRDFPEADRGGFFTLEDARRKLKPAQEPFLDRLATIVLGGAGRDEERA